VAADGSWKYRDVDEAAARVAGGLLSGSDDLREERIAFRVPPGGTYAALLLGIWRAGGIAVPLALSHPQAEIAFVVADAQARLVETAPLLSAAPAARLPNLPATRRAMILYTSGTTSRPKGVVTTHANIKAQVDTLLAAWEWRADDRILLALPLHHVHGIINGLASALAACATCEMLPAFDAGRVWDRFASDEITVFTAVPTMYHQLIAAWDRAAPDTRRRWADGAARLRLAMSGSSALPVTLLKRWRAITGQTLLERYGMTEIGMALSNPLHGRRRPGHVGAPLPNVEVRLVDEDGTSTAAVSGATGELEIRGPGVFLEYWRRPDETARAFRDGWFRTGDMACLDRGAYRILGRTSVDIIKTGGYKVSALEIEDVLRTHPSIAECAVVGLPDGEWGERVSAAVELRPGAALSIRELRQWAKARLAPYKVPRTLACVAALPRNVMGKVMKPSVAALFSAKDEGRDS
jgi:malonyl-CoA/methylmalonyl-CoA synthetase